MSSDLDTPISLEVFHRHFIETHKKANTAVVDELERRAARTSEPIGTLLAEYLECQNLSAAFREDKWFVREVPVIACYIAHPDLHCLCKLTKGDRFVDFVNDKREQIHSGVFPYSLKIRAPLTEMPKPIVWEPDTDLGKYYVFDGQLRLIRYCYHSVRSIEVFIYRGKIAL
jgi:hypothetical protein